jgi:hypothetical protein
MLLHTDVQAPGGVRLRRPACRRACGRGPPGCVRRRGRNACSCSRSRPGSHACRPWPRRRYGPPGAGDAMRCVYFPQALPPLADGLGVTPRSFCWTGGGCRGGHGHRGSAASCCPWRQPHPCDRRTVTDPRRPMHTGAGRPGGPAAGSVPTRIPRSVSRLVSGGCWWARSSGSIAPGPALRGRRQGRRHAPRPRSARAHGLGLRPRGTTAIDKPLPDSKADCGSCWASSADRGTMLLVVDPLTSVAACRWRSPATRQASPMPSRCLSRSAPPSRMRRRSAIHVTPLPRGPDPPGSGADSAA